MAKARPDKYLDSTACNVNRFRCYALHLGFREKLTFYTELKIQLIMLLNIVCVSPLKKVSVHIYI